MTSKIQVIDPSSELYERISGSLQQTKRRRHATTSLYNEVSEAYNRTEVEGFIVVDELNDKRLSNLEKVFLNRGLVRYVDYDVFRPTVDAEGNPITKENRKTLIKRMTDVLMRVV